MSVDLWQDGSSGRCHEQSYIKRTSAARRKRQQTVWMLWSGWDKIRGMKCHCNRVRLKKRRPVSLDLFSSQFRTLVPLAARSHELVALLSLAFGRIRSRRHVIKGCARISSRRHHRDIIRFRIIAMSRDDLTFNPSTLSPILTASTM